ncbi:MAG: glutathione S-transferase family protein [Pseudomonadota bacterium]
MELLVFPPAPNAAKVIYFVREKGIDDLPITVVDVRQGEQNSDAFKRRNPRGTVPVLSLDDDTHITESLTIMEYLETCYPSPPMLGQDALEQAQVRGAERAIEMNIFLRLVRIIHATCSPIGLPPNPGVAQLEGNRLPGALTQLDATIGEDFVVGGRATIADCTLLAGFQFAELVDYDFGLRDYPAICRWHANFSARHRGALALG